MTNELIDAFKEHYERYGPTWRGTDDAIVEILREHDVTTREAAQALGKQLGLPTTPLPRSGIEN